MDTIGLTQVFGDTVVMATNLTLATFQGFSGGININDPSHMIGDEQVVWMQDAWIFNIGKTIRRGPVTDVSGMVTFTTKIVGIAQTVDPSGTLQTGILHTDGTTLKLGVLSSNYGSKVDLTIGTTVAVTPYPLIDVKPKLGGGVWIGASQQTNASPAYQFLVAWDGANLASYSTGTLSVANGSRAVTGSGTSWVANACPGMYLINSSGIPVGMVQSVTSNTALTLVSPVVGALSTASYTLQSIRSFVDRIVSGTLTVSSGSTAVTGGDSSFVDEGLDSTWNMYRYSDGVLIGSVSSTVNNTALTLTSGAAVTMQEDAYFAVKSTDSNVFTITDATKKKPGFLTAVYSGRQWYANRGIPGDAGGEWTSRVWFSEPTGPEDLDMATITGSYIPVTSSSIGSATPIKAIVPAYNSLLILKERESFALTGTDESSFQLNKIGDDGCLSSMSAVAYGGGVIWAGRDSVYYYNGVNTIDLVGATLGTAYKQSIKAFDPATYRMWGALVHDHYFLHIENYTAPTPIIKGQAAVTPTKVTFAIYMPGLTNNSDPPITAFTNVAFRGSVTMNTGQGLQGWFVVNDSTIGHVCDWDTMFYTQGTDAFACDGGTAGPDLYVETKHHGLGSRSNPGDLLKKSWKQVMMSYNVSGDSLKIDTVIGLNEIGQVTTTDLPITVQTWSNIGALYQSWTSLNVVYPTWTSMTTSGFGVGRIKFLKRNQYFGFRVYQKSGSVNNATLGSYALGYKPLRPGRI